MNIRIVLLLALLQLMAWGNSYAQTASECDAQLARLTKIVQGMTVGISQTEAFQDSLLAERRVVKDQRFMMAAKTGIYGTITATASTTVARSAAGVLSAGAVAALPALIIASGATATLVGGQLIISQKELDDIDEAEKEAGVDLTRQQNAKNNATSAADDKRAECARLRGGGVNDANILVDDTGTPDGGGGRPSPCPPGTNLVLITHSDGSGPNRDGETYQLTCR